MALFALSDTHLSLGGDKPMDIFGERWTNHTERIEYFWKKTVTDGDTVVIPGDISWGMSLEDALPDLRFLDALPGKKILGKGNHDFWWSTLTKMNALLEKEKLQSISFLFNNAYTVEGAAVCGTRGWFFEGADMPGVDREKVIAREVGRLRRSLECGKALGGEPLVFMHFPPVFGDFICEELLSVLLEFGVKKCFYGHIHGPYSLPRVFTYRDIDFAIVSADHLQFMPLCVL